MTKTGKDRIYIGYSGQRYVYYHNKKRITAVRKRFKSIKGFKDWIQRTKGKVPAKDFKQSLKTTEFKEAYHVESQKALSKKFYIIGSYFDWRGNSGILQNPSRSEIIQAKEDIINQIVMQILYKNDKITSKIYEKLDIDMIPASEKDDYYELYQKVEHDTKFSYQNIYEKNA